MPVRRRRQATIGLAVIPMTLATSISVGLPFLEKFFGLHAQTLGVSANPAMMDRPSSIRATGLQPNERVAIRAELADGEDARWTSQADFVADSQGNIDTSKQPAVAGSYKEVSSMGLIWSMMPASRKTARYQPPRNFASQTVEFHLMRGSAQTGVRAHGTTSGSLKASSGSRCMMACFAACCSCRREKDRHPAVLVLGGSEGGMPARRAAWLASHGYAALALAYFRYDDLPKELARIPLEYFGQALKWMGRRPEIASDRIAVMGISRGAELALELGSMYPTIKGVVAYSPTYEIRPVAASLQYHLCVDMERLRRTGVSTNTSHGRPANNGDARRD